MIRHRCIIVLKLEAKINNRHASKLLVRVGQEVTRGDVIAQVGSTGISTSNHLHYEVRIGGKAMNPMNYVIGRVLP